MSAIRGVFEKIPGSGVWWVRYADISGRIRREKAGTKTVAAALYRKRKTEVLQGRKLPEHLRARQVTVAELANDALEYSKLHKGSHRTDICRMRSILGGFGSRTADSVTPQEIERWLASRARERGWSAATVNRYKALLSLVFRLGLENGKVSSNPARLVRRRNEENARTRYLTDEEAERLRGVVEKEFPEHLAELDIALNTGMRRGEQYSLSWDDVDFERRVLTLRKTKNRQVRRIPLNSTALRSLKKLRLSSDDAGAIFVSSRSGARLTGTRHWFTMGAGDAGRPGSARKEREATV